MVYTGDPDAFIALRQSCTATLQTSTCSRSCNELLHSLSLQLSYTSRLRLSSPSLPALETQMKMQADQIDFLLCSYKFLAATHHL